MSDQLRIDPLKDANVKIIRAKGKRGGQSGNTNALRHGFYAKNLGIMSPSKYNEKEMRNLLGEAAMLKDYMYILYNCNLESHDSAILAETLRAISLAGMALSRLLEVHKRIRISASAIFAPPSDALCASERGSSSSDSSLSDILSNLNAAGSRANSLASSILHDDDIDE